MQTFPGLRAEVRLLQEVAGLSQHLASDKSQISFAILKIPNKRSTQLPGYLSFFLIEFRKNKREVEKVSLLVIS